MAVLQELIGPNIKYVSDLPSDTFHLYCPRTMLRSMQSMYFVKAPGKPGQAWHQDCSPENKEIYNLNRLVYTMDINKSTGGELVLIPGSHKKGMIPSDFFGNEIGHEVIIEPNKGSLAILHGHLWHKVLPIHDNIRVSTNYRCIPSGTPDNITDICVK